VPVEDGVEREVVLPEPTADERDTGFGEVEGGPVLGGVDRLDSVTGSEMRVEIRKGPLPDTGLGGDI
jgi:hypothetical protein